MPNRCLDIAKEAHDPVFDIVAATKATQTLPGCNPAYLECIKNMDGMCSRSNYSYKQLANHSPDTYEPGATQGNPVTCVLQIAPDHFKYFLDNDSAEIPIPSNQNCPLRELHRVAHVELGSLA
ncbi:unnamed protein product [Aspergillus oryzae var. brunneus]|uniref:Unnamed protein product n=1 Tax=Aspergillus oryzae var. brunneus TaxID=332754 RepID=A0ABQ6L9M5_ASPOZ|nr:unnamed protein product [Aspergillus oryzae var. brunneus]